MHYISGGEEYFQPADVVLLASYTYENVRLLLLSKSQPFPNGLSNNAGQVGKHYMTHNTASTLAALFPFDLNNWYGLPAQGVAVDNWADDNFDHAGLDFIGGGNLWVYSDRRPIAAASMSTFGKAPTWGSAWKSFIKQNADRWNLAYIQKTTLPYEDNYLDLDPTVKDALGFPVCRITAEFKDNEKKSGAFMQDKMAQWFMEAGAVAVERGPVLGAERNSKRHFTLAPTYGWFPAGFDTADLQETKALLAELFSASQFSPPACWLALFCCAERTLCGAMSLVGQHGLPALRRHFKHASIVDPIHIEVAIQGKNPPQIEGLGGGNQGGVCQVHGCVAVLLHELPHPRLFLCRRGVDLRRPSST